MQVALYFELSEGYTEGEHNTKGQVGVQRRFDLIYCNRRYLTALSPESYASVKTPAEALSDSMDQIQ